MAVCLEGQAVDLVVVVNKVGLQPGLYILRNRIDNSRVRLAGRDCCQPVDLVVAVNKVRLQPGLDVLQRSNKGSDLMESGSR